MATPQLSIEQAAVALKRGGILAYPTEAVWGLGCDPMNHAAVLRLLQIKQRDVDKGLILIAADLDQFKSLLDYAALPTDRLAEVLATWPGPHTWVMPAGALAPSWITGAHAGIAVRISAHPVVIALCNAFDGALVSTSANLAGAAAPKLLSEFEPALLSRIDGVVQGDTGALERRTAICDARSGVVLRD
ncbi:MAG: Sua5/YciO/YrdC/YwlC family protein [Lysobacter sp.]|nr:Sua5/YciO/YrdC/YwlC family protein [Lysobacter sp.]